MRMEEVVFVNEEDGRVFVRAWVLQEMGVAAKFNQLGLWDFMFVPWAVKSCQWSCE